MYIALKSILLINKKKTVSFVKYRNLQFKKIILACITLNDGRGQL